MAHSLNRLELVLHRFGDLNEAEAIAAFSRFRALCKSSAIHPVDLRLRHEKGSGDPRAEHDAKKYLTQIALLESQITNMNAQVSFMRNVIVQLRHDKEQLEHTTLRLQQIIVRMQQIIDSTPRPRQRPRSSKSSHTTSSSDVVVEMMRRPEGASMREIGDKMGWLLHSTRAFIARVIRRKLGHVVTTTKTDDRGTVYRI